jgi:hypothetical protein
MHPTLTFATVTAALVATLIAGAGWGIALGLLVYIAGRLMLLEGRIRAIEDRLLRDSTDPLLGGEAPRRLLEPERQAANRERIPETSATMVGHAKPALTGIGSGQMALAARRSRRQA